MFVPIRLLVPGSVLVLFSRCQCIAHSFLTSERFKVVTNSVAGPDRDLLATRHTRATIDIQKVFQDMPYLLPHG